jgi:hypothetical protein
MRVNRGADYAHLFNGEENKITITFKLFNGQLELFYKEDGQCLFPVFKKSARYEDEWRFCTECQIFFKGHGRCPTHGILLRTLPRKKKGKQIGYKYVSSSLSTLSLKKHALPPRYFSKLLRQIVRNYVLQPISA